MRKGSLLYDTIALEGSLYNGLFALMNFVSHISHYRRLDTN